MPSFKAQSPNVGRLRLSVFFCFVSVVCNCKAQRFQRCFDLNIPVNFIPPFFSAHHSIFVDLCSLFFFFKHLPHEVLLCSAFFSPSNFVTPALSNLSGSIYDFSEGWIFCCCKKPSFHRSPFSCAFLSTAWYLPSFFPSFWVISF